MRSQSDQPLRLGRELESAEQLCTEFPVALVPPSMADSGAEHVTVAQAGQSQVMGLTAAENGEPNIGADAQIDGLSRRPEALTDLIFPDAVAAALSDALLETRHGGGRGWCRLCGL